ncbi:MAG: glutamate racemase [Pyrinomonadaceae bacterium]
MSRIGIIDWGIGGISVYKLIKDRMRGVPVTYFSDTGAVPYGKMSRVQLALRLDAVIEYLKSRGVTHVVIGCNAASTAIGDLSDHGVAVIGVIEPAVAMTAKLRPQKLGLIGGRRTVVSGVIRIAFAKRGIGIRQRIAQPLSALIESGDVSSAQLHSEARRILRPLRGCSHVLLACTHYPAILGVLRQHAPNVSFIDPAEELVELLKRQKIARSRGLDEFLTTGSTAAMKKAAKTAFSVKIPSVTRISL